MFVVESTWRMTHNSIRIGNASMKIQPVKRRLNRQDTLGYHAFHKSVVVSKQLGHLFSDNFDIQLNFELSAAFF
jgi:hypothetical protein